MYFVGKTGEGVWEGKQLSNLEFRAEKISLVKLDNLLTNTIGTLENIGAVYESADNLTAARFQYQSDLLRDEAGYGPDHPKMARRHNDLGRVMRKTGNLKGAYLHFKQALEIDELAYGPLSHQVALRFHILGDLMREMGGLMDARSCFQHALEINEKLYGSNSREVVEILINLVEIAKA